MGSCKADFSKALICFFLFQLWTWERSWAVDLTPAKPEGAIRIATFNVSLNRANPEQLTEDLRGGADAQCWAIASLIRAVQPDILLLNELDYSSQVDNAGLFHDQYLSSPQKDSLGGDAWKMPYRFSAPVNTGVPSQLDLNRNGRTDDPEDAWGFGRFPGQYGMAVFSRFEIDQSSSRTFQNLLWSDLPGALQPTLPETGQGYYAAEVWRQLRLPSKSLWDVVVQSPGGDLHILASHPTPPVFDGPEDRNGCRNHDEIRLLLEYIQSTPMPTASGSREEFWLDDAGRSGSLPPDAAFVILGDLNCDPHDGDSRREALLKLLAHRRVQSHPVPASPGAEQAARQQAGKNSTHHGDASHDTGDFNDGSVGNLRVDYVLPSTGLTVVHSGVVWPDLYSQHSKMPPALLDTLKKLDAASDHHLVWVDVQLAQAAAVP